MQIFAKDFNIDRLLRALRALRALTNVDIVPGKTLIILDEVQEIPEAVESLKYFYEEAAEYHIAVAGSLFGISLHQNFSYPIGKVDTINVFPMDFEEFVLAKGEYEVLKILHEKYIDLLRQYYYVGGMPEVVKKYIEAEALQDVRNIQLEILNGYEMDFSKHPKPQQLPRIRMVWRSVASQLFKENKKFIYGVLKKGARAKEFEIAIQWLLDAGLLYKVPRCDKMAQPLSIYEDLSAFKLYVLDVGLLGAMVRTTPLQVLVSNDIFTEYKGGMTEQYVLQQLISKGVAPIYYYSSENSRLEVDFIIQNEIGEMLPIEVKAGVNVRSNSLSNLLSRRAELKAFRFSMLPYKEQGQLTSLPLYAVGTTSF